MIVQVTGEAGDSDGWSSGVGLLDVCRERAMQLEVCLEKAQISLKGSREGVQDLAMQHSVEKQLHTCQVITHLHTPIVQRSNELFSSMSIIISAGLCEG